LAKLTAIGSHEWQYLDFGIILNSLWITEFSVHTACFKRTNFATNRTTVKSKNFSGISIILSISMVLFILGLFGLLIVNTNKVTNYLKENVLVILYFDEEVNDTVVDKTLTLINEMQIVKSANFVSKEDAAFQYKEVLEKDFVEILGDNPLPSSVEIYLNAEVLEEGRENAIITLMEMGGVNEVDFQNDLIAEIEQNRKLVGNILIVLALLLVLVSLVLVNNAIRLSVYSKRFLVKSMQLVGATEWFIIKPFVLRGIVQVVIAAILAMLLTMATYFGVGGWIQSNVLGPSIDIISMDTFKEEIWIYSLLFATLVGLGIVIVIPGTYFATQKYLRLKVDDLY
jgi:cell division transport system permease protein